MRERMQNAQIDLAFTFDGCTHAIKDAHFKHNEHITVAELLVPHTEKKCRACRMIK